MDTSVAKRLKLEVRKFERLIPTFVDVAVEKLGGGFFNLHPNRVNVFVVTYQ